MKEIKLPSGAVLKISPSPFATAKALYQSFLREVRGLKINSKMEMSEIYKDLFCIGFSSPEVEKALWECMARCTYNGGRGDLKIDADTFEPIAAREDYLQVCTEVAKENLMPFTKDLYAEFRRLLAILEDVPQ